jgi:DNA polymerase V
LSSTLKVKNVQAKNVQARNDRVYRIPLATERVAAGAASPAQSHVDQALI